MDAAKYYTSIVDLPLSKFIDCLVDKNIHALVIKGDPTREELQSAWDELLYAYNEAMGDAEGKMYYTLLKEAGIISAKITLVKLAIARLSMEYKKEMHDDLNFYTDFKYKLDINNPEEYKKELERAERRSRSMLLQYDLKKAQVEAFEEKHKKKGLNTKPTKEYFLSVLITLTDFSKVPLTTEMPVFEFCERVKRYGQHIKLLEDNEKKKK